MASTLFCSRKWDYSWCYYFLIHCSLCPQKSSQPVAWHKLSVLKDLSPKCPTLLNSYRFPLTCNTEQGITRSNFGGTPGLKTCLSLTLLCSSITIFPWWYISISPACSGTPLFSCWPDGIMNLQYPDAVSNSLSRNYVSSRANTARWHRNRKHYFASA